MKKLDTDSHTLMAPEEAERIAAEMSAIDEEWEYRPNHDPKGTGWSFIEIYERETGEFVACWNL